MLSYQHIFHAGNHADLLKHYILSFVIDYLNKKDKPYTFFDTHSASGIYDLLDNRSQKTKEADKGIISILQKNNIPSQMDVYLNLIKNFLNQNLYPGSPLIELSMLRKDDVMVLSEIHPQEIENLKNNIKKYKKNDSPQVQIHNRSGWEMLNALTPPKTKRGAVLIDPSYEETKDYEDAVKTVLAVNKKWGNGIIMLWYPLLNHRTEIIDSMLSSIKSGCLQNNPNTDICDFNLVVYPKDAHKETSLDEYLKQGDEIKNPPRLYGSGVLVINAPYTLKENCDAVIKYLNSQLYSE